MVANGSDTGTMVAAGRWFSVINIEQRQHLKYSATQSPSPFWGLSLFSDYNVRPTEGETD